MVQLLPGASAVNVQNALREGSIAAQNAVGMSLTGSALLEAYRKWANEQLRMLGTQLTSRAIDQLVTTPRYWTLQAIDPGSYGPALMDFVRIALDEARRDFDRARTSIEQRMARWGAGQDFDGRAATCAVVLDTNILLKHHQELSELDWNSIANVRPPARITLALPIVVVEELDGLKLSNGSMEVRGESVRVRSLARAALRTLEDLFPASDTSGPLWTDLSMSRPVRSPLVATLIIDDGHRLRLGNNDDEILDQAIGLKSFASTVALATYDNAMIFRARQLGIFAKKPEDDLLT